LSYQILPNIIFIASILGILLLILRHLPEAKARDAREQEAPPAEEKLRGKGLPTQAVSSAYGMLRVWSRKVWNYVLEAKDLKPATVTGYKIKKIFGEKQKLSEMPTIPSAMEKDLEKPKDEHFYLEVIKQDPKNFANYDLLGKFYIDRQEFEDSKDLYTYLVSHQPTNSHYHARLAYSFYRLKQYKKAAEHYKRSLSLDSSQPNRYYNLGLALEGAGDRKGSQEAFEKAIHLEPRNVKYYITLSNIQVKYGHKDKAKQTLKQAQKVEPQNGEVQKKLDELVSVK
jgi:tetratricopeptide (TPR) repeat protein